MNNNLKIQAVELRKQGRSYGEIASLLGISKTSAYTAVKDSRNDIALKANKDLNSRLERTKNVRNGKRSELEDQQKVEELTGNDLLKKEFDVLPFSGKFEALIGKPSRIFSAIIWGLPKGGKSNLSVRFADYLQEYFGNVLYISAEEGFSQTLKDKLAAIGGSNMIISNLKRYDRIHGYLCNKVFDFVFIDSINAAGIDNERLEQLKADHPTTSFVAIVQATKGGNFKGDQGLTHNCDFIIKVVHGIAYHSGRFNTSTELPIFEDAWYEKNPNTPKVEENGTQTQKLNEQPIDEQQHKLEIQEGAIQPEALHDDGKYSLIKFATATNSQVAEPTKKTSVGLASISQLTQPTKTRPLTKEELKLITIFGISYWLVHWITKK